MEGVRGVNRREAFGIYIGSGAWIGWLARQRQNRYYEIQASARLRIRAKARARF